MLALCVLIAAQSIISNATRDTSSAWGIYHYYIGAKYFKEVGYTNLYSCTLKAGKEADIETWNKIHTYRDLSTYKIKAYTKSADCPDSIFTKSRWKAFTEDISVLTSWSEPSYWKKVVTDKGFNPTPFWVLIAQAPANIFSLNNIFVQKTLFNLDPLFIILTTLIIWLNKDKKTALLTLFLSLIFFGTNGRISNNFLQFIWFPLLAATVLAWHKKRFLISGAMLGLATGLQAFSIFFAIPVFLNLLFSTIKKHPIQVKRSGLFVSSFIFTIIFCYMAGGLSERGLEGWIEWKNKITMHRNYINGELLNIGYVNLASTLTSKEKANTHSYIEDTPKTIQRNIDISQSKNIWHIIALLWTTLWIISLWRSSDNDPLKYGYVPLYIFLTLSPYYYLTLALVPLFFSQSQIQSRNLILQGVAIMFFIQLLLSGDYFNYNTQAISELLVALFILEITIVLALPSSIFRPNKN